MLHEFMVKYLLFTSVFSQLCISITRKALAMAIFASSRANRIPIQFLKIDKLHILNNSTQMMNPSNIVAVKSSFY